MKDAQKTKEAWIDHQIRLCVQANDTLDAFKKQTTAAFDVRIRKIQAYRQTLLVKLGDSQQLELFDTTTGADAEIEALLTDPLHDLQE